MAIQRYKEEFGKTLEEIAKEIGKSKDYVSRLLATLELPEEIIEDLRKNKSTKDVKALAEINNFAKKIKKLASPTFAETDLRNTKKSLYYGLLEHGREWLKDEIKRLLSLQEEKSERPFTIKKERKRVVFAINRSKLDDEKNQGNLTILSLSKT